MEVELDNVRIDQEKTKGQIRRKNAKLLQKRIESLEAAPPTGPLHVVLWEDNSMLPTDFSLFSLREPSRKDVSHICRWRLLVCIWAAQRGTMQLEPPKYWVVLLNKVVGPNDPPVKKTREHSAAKQLWPNRDATTRFPARAWREGVLLLHAQLGCRRSRTALATPG